MAAVKTKVGIGSGNIGTALMYQLRRSQVLELTWGVGVKLKESYRAHCVYVSI